MHVKRFALPLSSRAALVLALFAAAALADDRRADKTRLTVMTFNAEFLFDGVLPDGQANFGWKGSPTEAEDHMAEIAAEILANDPDIVNLCEVENLEVLETMNAKFLGGAGYKPYLIEGTDTFTGQDVGILTRIDPDGPLVRDERKGQSGSVKKSVSKHYVARITVEGEKVSLIGLHLLAIPLSNSRKQQREAQADAIRGMAVDEAAAGSHVIVLGDCNDFDGAVPDAEGSQPISNVLASIRAMSPSTTADDLANVATKLAESQRFTSWYDKDQTETISPQDEFTSIDHVLVSPALFAKVASVHFDQDHDPTSVSDHFPIVVTFQMKPSGDGGNGPAPTPGGLVILSLLPNPVGDETQGEEVTLKNFGSAPVALTGWRLRDKANTEWALDSTDGTVAASGLRNVKRRGRKMALNNDGDTVSLVDPNGEMVQTVTYGKTVEGEEVTP